MKRRLQITDWGLGAERLEISLCDDCLSARVTANTDPDVSYRDADDLRQQARDHR